VKNQHRSTRCQINVPNKHQSKLCHINGPHQYLNTTCPMNMLCQRWLSLSNYSVPLSFKLMRFYKTVSEQICVCYSLICESECCDMLDLQMLILQERVSCTIAVSCSTGCHIRLL
jgi:hypothetical protein